MPVETSAPVTGQTKTSVPMFPSVTRPAQEIETAIEHAVQEASHATQYARRATQHSCTKCPRPRSRMAHHNSAVLNAESYGHPHMEATMRNNPMMLMGAAALLVVGGAAFQAQATMGGGTNFSAQAKSYSLVEKASCSGQGLFCKAGSSLQCNPNALVCPAPLLRR